VRVLLHFRRILDLSFLLFTAAACTAPAYDPSTAVGKKAILEQVHYLLTTSQCDAAIDVIGPLYNSIYTDNEVRMAFASAHACKAELNYFQMVNSIATNPAAYTGAALWQTLTQIFQSAPGDDRMESTWLATDALQAAIGSGAVVPTLYQINPDTDNVGSLQPGDRTDDSNSYLLFVSMAGIGATQNRYGNPGPSGLKGTDLPWSTHDLMDEVGCAYAGNIVNMLDGINVASSTISGDVGGTLADIYDLFGAAIDNACLFGCTGADVFGVVFDADCVIPGTECQTCPLEVRNRTTCIESTKGRCAAAGVVRYINDDPLGFGWQ